MAASIAQGQQVFVDGADLACFFKSWTISREQEALDNTHLCNSGDMQYLAGLRNSTMNVDGTFDYDATDEDAISNILQTAYDGQNAMVVTASYTTAAAGGAVAMADGNITSYEVTAPTGQLVNATFSMQNSGNVGTGQWIDAKMDLDTETLNSAALDNAASSANGGIFHAHLFLEADSDATAGGTSVILQHSADNVTYVDLVASQTFAGTHGAKSSTVSGTVNRYIRFSVTSDGVAHVVASFNRL